MIIFSIFSSKKLKILVKEEKDQFMYFMAQTQSYLNYMYIYIDDDDDIIYATFHNNYSQRHIPSSHSSSSSLSFSLSLSLS